MTHTVTGKLNKAARTYDNASGTTFFVDIGERNFNYKTKESEYTNYSAALFANEKQKQFYTDQLVEGAIVSVTGTGLLIDMPDDPQYKPRLAIQDAKLVYSYSTGGAAPAPQPSAPAPAPQQPAPDNDFDDIPF